MVGGKTKHIRRLSSWWRTRSIEFTASLLWVSLLVLTGTRESSTQLEMQAEFMVFAGTEIFGGVGIASLPLGLIFAFIRRPKAVITRSQYIKEATELGKKAKELKKAADSLHQEERSGSKGRKWRKNVKAVEKELLLLEEDVKALEEMYPQGEKAETSWALTVLGYLAKLILGVLGLIVSVAWVAHIIIYLLIDPPLSAFLNEVFIKLDDVWGLFGTAAFAFFCFYLLIAVTAGAMMLGLRLVFITIHPMK